MAEAPLELVCRSPTFFRLREGPRIFSEPCCRVDRGDVLENIPPADSDFERPFPNVIVPNNWATSDDVWIERAAQYLNQYGMCALLADSEDTNNGVLNAQVCDGASQAAQERLAELHRRIASRGEDPDGAEGEYRYLEVVCRDPGGNRFDMQVGWMVGQTVGADCSDDRQSTASSFDHPGMPLEKQHEKALGAFHSELDQIVAPVIQRLFDSYEARSEAHARMSVASAGFLINRPGSTAQKWHKDGPDEGFIDAFVPLIDLTADLGPTEVQVGTHGEEMEDREEKGAEYFHRGWDGTPYSLAPILNMGDILLLDYRTTHRGLGNTSPSTTRPLAYAVFKHEKREDGDLLGDVRNFPAATTLEFD